MTTAVTCARWSLNKLIIILSEINQSIELIPALFKYNGEDIC